jgi:hypothetical protein
MQRSCESAWTACSPRGVYHSRQLFFLLCS